MSWIRENHIPYGHRFLDCELYCSNRNIFSVAWCIL
uniref:Uncharacterized protein n=1 Tax=Arundo donax TaxID=35708 RepID=A0A0A9AQ42_ARUDO